ncbi:MAG TPA: hypothetical protein VGY55_15100 [Pirellulales bacterium]|jgi:hypothetical protein|nr:hypothetical protein [Pirellulales bacterium]
MDLRIVRRWLPARRCKALGSVVVAVAIVLSLIRPSLATTRAWNALDGNWSVAGNWSPAGVPAGGDTANVLNTDGVSRTITYDYTGPAVTLAFLSVDLTGGMPTDTATFSMSANNLTSAFEYVGWSAGNGSGKFNQSGGVNTVNGTALYLGLNPTDNGYYNLSGTGSLVAAGNTGEIVGYSGTGTFTQSGGTNSLGTNNLLYLGYNSNSSGTYILSAGTLTSTGTLISNSGEHIAVGDGSAGTFIQSGGTNSLTFLEIGIGSGANGVYFLHGGLLTASSESIGSSHGSGTFNQDGGSNIVGPVGLAIGNGLGGSPGAYNLSGGFVSSPNVFVGLNSPGVLAVSGTGVLTVGNSGILVGPTAGTALNLSGGQINTPSLGLFSNPSLFNWTSGTLNITTNVVFDSSGEAGSSIANDFGPALSLGGGQTLMVTGNETLGGTGLFSLTVSAGGSNYVTGTLTISPTGTIEQDAGSTLYAASITQAGGTVNGTLQNQGVFNYQSGVFNGKLLNQGTVNLGPNFTAGNGIENDTAMTVATGQTVTANGDGFDNLALLTLTGGTVAGDGPLTNEFGGTIQGDGTVTSPLANFGTVSVSGVMSLAGGITNDGLVEGNGNITGALVNNVDGTVHVAAGNSLSITGAWTNNGLISLSDATARLGGGAIANHSALEGFGLVTSAVANTGTIEALGGTLSFGGTLTNSAAGLLTAGSGAKLLVTGGLAANAGIINLTGGTFDNNNHPLNNTGQISGWGIFRTGGMGLDNNGSITFTGGTTTINGPVTNENGKTITVAYNPAIFTGPVTNTGTGTFNVIDTTVTFAGGSSGNVPMAPLVNAPGAAFGKAGSGVLEVDGAPSLGNSSSLAIGDSGTLRFKAISGTATVGAGVSARVASFGTLELAGSVSALSSGTNRANVVNNSSAAAGVLVSGTNQQVGDIDGAGTTQISDGSDLTANHIIQSALVIGGAATSHGLVTIDASDSSGNPLINPAAPEAVVQEPPLGIDVGLVNPPDGDSLASPAAPLNPGAVPEPSGLLLIVVGGMALVGWAGRQRALRRRGQHVALVLAAASLAAVSRSEAGVVITTPSGLHPGDEFRVAFVTDGTDPATSNDINHYNSFVNQDAINQNGGSQVVYGGAQVTFSAIASTDSKNAIDNIGIYNIPVFDAQGNSLVTPTNLDSSLFAGANVQIIHDLLGVSPLPAPTQNPAVWTGTQGNGTEAFTTGNLFVPIGLGTVNNLGVSRGAGSISAYGDPFIGSPGWLLHAGQPQSTQLFLYAISAPLTVPAATPEPSTFALGGVALICCSAVVGLRRKRSLLAIRDVSSGCRL